MIPNPGTPRRSVFPSPREETVPFAAPAVSDETHKLVDDEVRRIVDECYAESRPKHRRSRRRRVGLKEASGLG
jgi:ATP-dependent Zn protease